MWGSEESEKKKKKKNKEVTNFMGRFQISMNFHCVKIKYVERKKNDGGLKYGGRTQGQKEFFIKKGGK